MNTIVKADVLNHLHNLMGHRVATGGTTDDYDRYIQSAWKYAWSYYKWQFSLKSAAIAPNGDNKTFLPADMNLEGFRKFANTTEISIEDSLSGTSGSYLQYDPVANKYQVLPTAITDTVVYQVDPGVLSTDPRPFPDAMAIAVGAMIFARQAENPTRADIQQEWDEFHAILDRYVGVSDKNKPHTPVHYLDTKGTYVGNKG